MCGCASLAAVSASRWKRSTCRRSIARPGRSTLSATRRRKSSCSARYTTAIPPRPELAHDAEAIELHARHERFRSARRRHEPGAHHAQAAVERVALRGRHLLEQRGRGRFAPCSQRVAVLPHQSVQQVVGRVCGHAGTGVGPASDSPRDRGNPRAQRRASDSQASSARR
jgi:hypothetical protein